MRTYFFVCMAMITIAVLAVTPSFAMSPEEVEQIPFDHSLAASPNVDPLYQDDVSAIETHAGDDHHGEKKAGLPQFDVTTFSSQIFWLFITFTILYIFFAKKALPSLSATIEQRRATIKSDLDQADKLSTQIDEARDNYESALQEAHNQSRTVIADTQTHIRAVSEEETQKFNAHAAQSVTDLETRAENAKAAIKNDLAAIAYDLTADIVSKLSPLNVTNADIEKAVANNSEAKTSSTKKKAA